MAGQGAKRCSLNSWCPIHVHTPMPMLSMLAGPCTQDGRWVHPKGSTLWWACHWGQVQRLPPTMLQGCIQAWHESMQHWHWFMGGLCRWQNPVEATIVTRTEKRGGCLPRKKWWKMGQENSQTSAGPPKTTSSICLHMSGMQQRLQIQDWPLQPHKTMHISKLSGCYSIVEQLTDAIIISLLCYITSIQFVLCQCNLFLVISKSHHGILCHADAI